MSIDRILQLKLVADVSDINKKTGAVTSEVGKIRGAFNGLSSFVGPAMLNLGLEAAGSLVDGLMGGFADAKAYDQAFGELESIVGDGAADLASEVDSLSFDLGFDDAETIAALNDFLLMTGGDVPAALELLQASMDLSASGFGDLSASVSEVGQIFKGESEKLAQYGITADGARYSVENVDAAIGHLGGTAEEYAGSIEGIGDRVGVAFDRGFATAATWLTDMAEDILPKLAALWEEIGPDVIAFAQKVGEVAGKIIELAVSITDKLRPVIDPLVAFWVDNLQVAFANFSDILDAIIAVLNGDFTSAWKSIENVIYRMVNKIIGTINSIGDAIKGFLDPFIDGFRSAINTVIGFWNDLGIHIPEIVLFEGFGRKDTFGPIDIELPNIPYLAKGGIVTGPTLAMIGEAGPEAVVPLNGKHGMGTTYNINVNAAASDPAEVGRKVVEAIKRYESRAGSSWRSS